MKKIVVFLILLVSSNLYAFDSFCYKTYKDSIQMQDYCEDIRKEYMYVIGTITFVIAKDNILEQQKIDHCLVMFSDEELNMDLENIYYCIITN